MSRFTDAGTALAIAAGLALTACTADSPTESGQPQTAFARPGACPGHPSCEDPGDGGDGPAASMALFSGGYDEDPTGSPQPVNVGKKGRIRSISETAGGVGVALRVPPFTDEAAFAGTCVHNGFGSAAEAMSFWNDVADDVVSAFRLIARMDTNSMGSNDAEHLNEIFWNDSKGIAEGNITRFRVGNHGVYGAARWSGSGGVYELTDGGLTLSVLGGEGNHELVGVTCDNRPGALGASFVIDLQ